MAIYTALDFLPFTNRRFCQMFNMDENKMYTDEGWRNGEGHQSGVARLIANADNDNSAAKRINTFDSLTETCVKGFDSDDVRNWQILALTSAQLVSDTIAILLEQQSKLVSDEDKKDYLPKLEVKMEVMQALIAYCKRFASMDFPEDDELEDLTIVNILQDQVTFTWANKIYPSLSTLGRGHFDYCLKFLQVALQNDHRKCK